MLLRSLHLNQFEWVHSAVLQMTTSHDLFVQSDSKEAEINATASKKKLKSVIFNSSFSIVLTLFVSPARENLPSRFKFKEYCPMVFRNLRERFCIDDQDYQVRPQTLTHKQKCSLALTGALIHLVAFGLAELSDQERPAQQRHPGPLRQPHPVQLRPPLRHQNRVQRGHRWDAQHPKEISPGRGTAARNCRARLLLWFIILISKRAHVSGVRRKIQEHQFVK